MKVWVSHIRSFFRILRQIFINGLLLRGYQKNFPKVLIIEPTNICNLQCTCCPHGNKVDKKRPAGFMTKDTFDGLIDNIDIPLKEVCLYLHGEPFLHKELDYFIERIISKNIKMVIYSNGYLIDLDLLDKLLQYKWIRFCFSIDIFKKEYYEQLRRPAQYEIMIEHLEKINTLFRKRNKMYEISMTIENEDIDEHHTLCEKIFFSYDRLRTITLGSLFPWPDHIYTGELDKRLLKKRRSCDQIEKGIAVYWNGDVTLCSYDYSGKLQIGNLIETKLSHVFNSSEARKIRTNYYLRRYKKLPLCRQCILPRYKSSFLSINRKNIQK